MALAPIESDALGFALRVERFYSSLMCAAEAIPGSRPEPTLGGQLLYAGELDAEARALLVAANIAGAASLAATADAAAQKQAVRDGVVDFPVTSLDEALRILKNQIRKRETVAVCVALAPEIVEEEMRERGVRPDLLRPDLLRPDLLRPELLRPELLHPELLHPELLHLEPLAPGDGNPALLAWRVEQSPALWLPKLDAIAAHCLPPHSVTALRWLRLAPRYFGRLAQGVRVLRCDQEAAKEFALRVQDAVARGEIAVPVEMIP